MVCSWPPRELMYDKNLKSSCLVVQAQPSTLLSICLGVLYAIITFYRCNQQGFFFPLKWKALFLLSWRKEGNKCPDRPVEAGAETVTFHRYAAKLRPRSRLREKNLCLGCNTGKNTGLFSCLSPSKLGLVEVCYFRPCCFDWVAWYADDCQVSFKACFV